MDTVRIGRVSSVNYEKGMVRVVYTDRDESVTAELPMLASEYNMPEKEDMILVVHLSNGTQAGIALGRLWNDANVPPESGQGLYRKDFGHTYGDSYLKYISGVLEIWSKSVITIHSATAVNIESGGEVNVTAPTVNVAGAAGDAVINGISLNNHTHTDSLGGGTSGPR